MGIKDRRWKGRKGDTGGGGGEVLVNSLISHSDRLVTSCRQINDPLSQLQCSIPLLLHLSIPPPPPPAPPSLISAGHPSTSWRHPPPPYTHTHTHFFAHYLLGHQMKRFTCHKYGEWAPVSTILSFLFSCHLSSSHTLILSNFQTLLFFSPSRLSSPLLPSLLLPSALHSPRPCHLTHLVYKAV